MPSGALCTGNVWQGLPHCFVLMVTMQEVIHNLCYVGTCLYEQARLSGLLQNACFAQDLPSIKVEQTSLQ